jgi:predicted acylesterase/phospholipase RssA
LLQEEAGGMGFPISTFVTQWELTRLNKLANDDIPDVRAQHVRVAANVQPVFPAHGENEDTTTSEGTSGAFGDERGNSTRVS